MVAVENAKLDQRAKEDDLLKLFKGGWTYIPSQETFLLSVDLFIQVFFPELYFF